MFPDPAFVHTMQQSQSLIICTITVTVSYNVLNGSKQPHNCTSTMGAHGVVIVIQDSCLTSFGICNQTNLVEVV